MIIQFNNLMILISYLLFKLVNANSPISLGQPEKEADRTQQV